MTSESNNIGKADTSKVSAKAITLIDRQIADAKARMIFAPNGDLERYYAERVIGLRFERGDFAMIQRLDKTIRRALVIALLKEKQPCS